MSPSKSSLRARRIVLIVSGSVAAFKAAALASKLAQGGAQVRTILTESAGRFVGAAQFEGLTRDEVHTSIFESGKAHVHLDLPKWAELTLVYPATANLLGKWAAGIADDLPGAYFLALRSPLWVAPAMNPRMWEHPAVKKSLSTLQEYGARILRPDQGMLACGDVGEGRLMEPDAVLTQAERFFSQDRPSRGSVLVTAGGTREPIDAVRSITNTSSGETGIRVAEKLAQSGYSVTLLQSQASRTSADPGIRSVRFDTFQDFHDQYKKLLSEGQFATLIHAAALSDFSLASESAANDRKIETDAELHLKLVPNPKLISRAREYSRGSLKTVISFKLTVGGDTFSAEKYPDSDFIVQNRLSEVRGESHRTTIYGKNGSDWRAVAALETKTELAQWISDAARGVGVEL